MPQDQKLKPNAKPREPATDQLEVLKAIEPPTINETIQKAQVALAQAKKRVRVHSCRVCNLKTCRHFERIDDETGEEFDLVGAPDLDENRR
jgi:hypothetical protein